MRKMQILVLTRDGRKSIYEVDRFGTVGHLKTRIGRHMAVPMGFSRLAYKGRVLANQSVLEEVGVKRMSTLELFWQPLVFTPRQFREKEDDLDKLEQKQRAMGSMSEGYDQKVKTGRLVQASGSFLGMTTPDEDVPIPSSSSAKYSLPSASRSCSKVRDIDEEDLEEVSSMSSDELEFLAAYRGRKTEEKKSLEELQGKDSLPFTAMPSIPISPDLLPIFATSGDKQNHKPVVIAPITVDPPVSSSSLKKKNKKNRKKK